MQLKPKQIQPDLLIKIPIYFAVNDLDDHLAGGADGGFVQMATDYMPFVIAGAHVQMAIECIIHGVDGSRERDDLIAAVKGVGIILFLIGLKDADGKVIDGAEGLYAGQFDIFLKGEDLHLL